MLTTGLQLQECIHSPFVRCSNVGSSKNGDQLSKLLESRSLCTFCIRKDCSGNQMQPNRTFSLKQITVNCKDNSITLKKLNSNQECLLRSCNFSRINLSFWIDNQRFGCCILIVKPYAEGYVVYHCKEKIWMPTNNVIKHWSIERAILVNNGMY